MLEKGRKSITGDEPTDWVAWNPELENVSVFVYVAVRLKVQIDWELVSFPESQIGGN